MFGSWLADVGLGQLPDGTGPMRDAEELLSSSLVHAVIG